MFHVIITDDSLCEVLHNVLLSFYCIFFKLLIVAIHFFVYNSVIDVQSLNLSDLSKDKGDCAVCFGKNNSFCSVSLKFRGLTPVHPLLS